MSTTSGKQHNCPAVFAVMVHPDINVDLLVSKYDEVDERGKAILAHALEGHTNIVRSLSFSPDCKLL